MTTEAAAQTIAFQIATKISPGPLTVERRGDDASGQFSVKSDYFQIEGDWDDVYVHIHGYFGSYGPDLFAAAPDLEKALEPFAVLGFSRHELGRRYDPATVENIMAARAALAKARGA